MRLFYVVQVRWDPYRQYRGDHPFHEVAFYTGCLKCMDIVEPCHPNRVLGQFNKVQRIPPAPLALMRAMRNSTTNQYQIAYQYLNQIGESWPSHVLSPLNHGAPMTQS